MPFSNQPTYGFSHKAVFKQLDSIEDPASRGAVILKLLQAYKETNTRWDVVLHADTNGINKQRTEEYAEILGCKPEYESVVSASYNLMHVWPHKTAPLLETTLDILNIRAETEKLYRVIEWERLSKLFYFDIRRVMKELEEIEDVARKIQVLEEIRQSVLNNGRSGTLILIDPNTGNEVQPEEEAYGDVVVAALRDYLDPELYKLKTIPYLAGKRGGTEPEYDPHYEHQIRWSASPRALVALLEGLLSLDLIDSTLDQLPALGVCHFSDKFEHSISMEELLPYFSGHPQVASRDECSPIVWKGDQPPLAHLIVSLAHRTMIAHKTSAYLDLVITHFVKKDGTEFDRGTMRSSKGRIKAMKEGSKSLHNPGQKSHPGTITAGKRTTSAVAFYFRIRWLFSPEYAIVAHNDCSSVIPDRFNEHFSGMNQ